MVIGEKIVNLQHRMNKYMGKNDMKKQILMALFVALPCMATAQSEWEVPDQKPKQERQTLFGKSQTPIDPKYLAADAVPMVDGKIVFTLDEDVPGKSAQEIYDIVFSVLERMVKSENQFEESKIALVNKSEHATIRRECRRVQMNGSSTNTPSIKRERNCYDTRESSARKPSTARMRFFKSSVKR